MRQGGGSFRLCRALTSSSSSSSPSTRRPSPVVPIAAVAAAPNDAREFVVRSNHSVNFAFSNTSGVLLCRRMGGLQASSSFGCQLGPLVTSFRFQSSGATDDDAAPTDDEVKRALGVLGLPVTATFSEARQKYFSLAKQHHPDVAAAGAASTTNSGSHASTTTTNMTSINAAYQVLNRHQKKNQWKLRQPSSSSSSFSSNPYTQSGGYSYGASYQPMWEADDEAAFHEAMWEAMGGGGRGGGAGNYHQYRSSGGGFSPPPYGQQRFQQRGRGQGGFYQGARRGGGGGQHKSKKQAEESTAPPPPPPSTWSPADQQALQHMYQDGKSFAFVANALGKKEEDVMSEFNRWQQEKKSKRRQSQDGRRGRGGGGRRGEEPFFMGSMYGFNDMSDAAFYNTQVYDAYGNPIDIHLHYDMDEDELLAAEMEGMGDGRSSMYVDDDDDDDDEREGSEMWGETQGGGGGPMPFTGRPTMHRGRSGRGGGPAGRGGRGGAGRGGGHHHSGRKHNGQRGGPSFRR